MMQILIGSISTWFGSNLVICWLLLSAEMRLVAKNEYVAPVRTCWMQIEEAINFKSYWLSHISWLDRSLWASLLKVDPIIGFIVTVYSARAWQSSRIDQQFCSLISQSGLQI